MTRQETVHILAILKGAYPHFYKDMTASELENVVDLWSAMLSNYAAEEVAAAVKAHIASDTKGFAPVIGSIISSIQKNRSRNEMTEMEAWSYVQRAVSRAGWYAREEFTKLPPLIQELVGSPEQLHAWSNLSDHELQTVTASNFQRSFRNKIAAVKEYQSLPEDVKSQIAEIADGMKIQNLSN